MHTKSHSLLGQKLIDLYMSELPFPCQKAFLLGCIQPDKNPTTYIKGSMRNQWLRGHNWNNSRQYLCKLICRLEKKHQFHIIDYYSLGKLVHYISDAFTYVHNDTISAKLKDHIKYEVKLEAFFLPYLENSKKPLCSDALPCRCILYAYHKKYLTLPGSVVTDTVYIYRVCSNIVYKLLSHNEHSLH